LYILQQTNPDSIGYNIPIAFEPGGEVHREKIENTLKKLINRHESLRTSFHLIEEGPVQKIHEKAEFQVEYYETKTGVPEIFSNFIRPFDPGKIPLMRVGLIKIEESKHLLIVDIHHIIADAISLEIIAREFAALYGGKESPVNPIQYKDFCQWQNRLFASGEIKKQEAYWLNEFPGEIPIIDLPGDYERPPVKSFKGSSMSFEISPRETKLLKELALRAEATLFVVLLSLYYILLLKITNQEDLVIGTAIAGRGHVDLKQVIGVFINTLALRFCLKEDKAFIEFLKNMKEKILAAFENQEYQFEDLVEKVVLERDISRNPLFDVEFLLETPEVTELDISGLKLTNYELKDTTSKFDLSLQGKERRESLVFKFEYCSELFKKETIRRFITYFKKIVSSVLDDAQKKVYEIEVITGEEKRRLLFAFNDTKAEYPGEKRIHQLFEEQVENKPDKIAIVSADRQLSYRVLNGKANQVARTLRARGVRPEALVGIIMERCPQLLVAVLAILKAGAAFLPIDKQYPGPRKKFILEDSKAEALITGKYIYEKNKEVFQNLTDENILFVEDENIYAGEVSNLEITDKKPADLAYVIYTSGTTGKPKGVLVEHRGVVNYIYWAIKKYVKNEHVNFPLYTSISFDLTVTSIFTPLLSGHAIVIYSGDDREFLLENIIAENRVEVVKVTPSHLKLIRDRMSNNPDLHQERKNLSIKRFIVGGENLEVDLARDISEIFGGNIEIYNEYGPTETVVGCMIYQFDPGTDDRKSVPIGVPIDNTRVYILDKKQNPVPPGVPGELCVSGVGLARGYLRRDETTSEKFIGNPFIKKSRLYRTGDLARHLPNGNIEFLGRMDKQVKIRGFRIELAEIEHQLLNHKEIKEAVVLAKKDENGSQYLCAYIIPARASACQKSGSLDFSSTGLNVSALREYLLDYLPDYMVPSHFIRLDKIPLTANGKVDQKALQPLGKKLETGVEYAAPGSGLEKTIVNAWRDILKRDNIGIYDNFFDLGGTSLSLILINRKLKNTLKKDLSVLTMFEYPTVNSLARFLNRQEDRESLSARDLDKSKRMMKKTIQKLRVKAR
jgi:tyrocidine synthetase-3